MQCKHSFFSRLDLQHNRPFAQWPVTIKNRTGVTNNINKGSVSCRCDKTVGMTVCKQTQYSDRALELAHLLITPEKRLLVVFVFSPNSSLQLHISNPHTKCFHLIWNLFSRLCRHVWTVTTWYLCHSPWDWAATKTHTRYVGRWNPVNNLLGPPVKISYSRKHLASRIIIPTIGKNSPRDGSLLYLICWLDTTRNTRKIYCSM